MAGETPSAICNRESAILNQFDTPVAAENAKWSQESGFAAALGVLTLGF